jgi:hypothetical protein
MSIYVETSANSLKKYGEELCGDKVEMIRNNDKVTVVLADGLGSGVKANILASLTSKIAATMLSEGADIVEVVETIASTLPVCRVREVAYSTFSILQVDHNGLARLVEFDNPEALLLRDGKEVVLAKTTMDVEGKIIRESNFNMIPGDACILFSDGAVHAGVGKLLNFGWQRQNIVEYMCSNYNADMPARLITSQLLSACNSLYTEQPGDDTTVVTAKVCMDQPCTLLVGPPADANQDCDLVHKFIGMPGRKAVCGGTTSQIVSRLTGRELTVNLEYETPDVPPVGYIDGIDLVTEGVVTLGKAYKIIKKYCAGIYSMSSVPKLDEKDGASMLAKLLLEQSTEVRFLVGRALNPAHQNPNMPFDLGIKLGLIRNIAKLLQESGKKVFIEYY